ncbi:serine hydrolase [Spirosoma sp. KCTC 42546]|uniref:serine hydrolase n=1 Tax=Spirosoma sp. KCTC 42546 TaxID=2520506 RepID=UPI001158D49B|nr:serine hydrolase [Spirosoma sp. KCTC 42546]QDK82996.1 serine hydrolase [Spirosoma sp. KCTC 42546]
MKRSLWGVLVCLTGSLNAQPVKTTTEKLDEYLTVAANLHRFNGTILVAQKGAVLLQKGYGWRNEGAKIPNDTSSIYQLGSVTKTFTAEAILQLQEEKKLAVKDKLSKYLPDYPNGDQITIEQLFAHTSGIYDYKSVLYGKDSLEFTRPVTKERVLSTFKDKPLKNKPGKQVNYTNSGYFLLGLIIEKVTQKPFETVIREQFINPLQLTRTGFDFINLKRPDKTTGYTYWKDSVLVAVRPLDSTAAYAAGGMYSSVGDLYRWAQAIRASQLLKPVSQALAFTPIKPGNWGQGWGINYFVNRKKLVFQNGNLPGFATFIILIPEDDVTLIMLANVDDTSDMTTLEPMVKDLLFITYGMPYQLPVSFKTVHVSETLLAQYVGKYQLDPKRILAITFEQKRLFLQVTGQERFEIFPSSETDFFLKVVNAQLTFQKDANGRVTQVVVHQNGDLVAKRL